MKQNKRGSWQRLDRYHGKACPYCARIMMWGNITSPNRPTRDHLLPRKRGGLNLLNNQLVVCARCNNEKDNRTITEWLAVLERRRDRRAPFVYAVVKGAEYAGLILYPPKETEPCTSRAVNAPASRACSESTVIAGTSCALDQPASAP